MLNNRKKGPFPHIIVQLMINYSYANFQGLGSINFNFEADLLELTTRICSIHNK